MFYLDSLENYYEGDRQHPLDRQVPRRETPYKRFNGSTWEDDPANPAPPPEDIPKVTMRQARLALLNAGVLDQVDTLIAAQPKVVQIWWEYSTEVHRHSPLVAQVLSALHIPENQIDALFTAAGAL